MKLNEVFSPLNEKGDTANAYTGSDHPLDKVLDQYADIIKPLVQSGGFLYRGMGYLPQNFGFGDGSKMNRQSANTSNYYTLLMDNVPEWKPYPKRSQSFICSSGRSGASGYGSSVYMVIPLEGQTIGVCPEADLWGSFGDASLSNINSALRYMWRKLHDHTALKDEMVLSENDFSLFKRQLDEASRVLTTVKLDDDFVEETMEDLVDEGFKDWADLFGTYRKILNPESHGFTHTTTIPDFDNRRECWLSGKVLFVTQEDLHNHFR